MTDDTKPKKLSESGSSYGYKVEVRLNYVTPKVINGVTLGNRWQEMATYPASNGVPNHRNVYCAQQHLFDYAAAETLRYWFIAKARETHDDIFLETRLARHEVTWKVEHWRVGEALTVTGDNALAAYHETSEAAAIAMKGECT